MARSASLQISREIRTGFNYEYVVGGFKFVNSNGETVYYFLDDASLKRAVGDTSLGEKITADNVVVNNFMVLLLDNNPMRITLTMSVSSNNIYLNGVSTNVQSTISQRDYTP